MSIAVYSPGDKVYYPRWTVPSGKTMELEDYNIHLYRSRKVYVDYLWKDLLDIVVQEMKENVEDAFDNVVAINGGEGTGKSNLAYDIAIRYDPDFNMEESLFNNFKDLITRLHENPPRPGAVLWLDEATAISNNRDWNTQDAKDFVKLLEMFRSRRWCIILCIPLKRRMDVYLREARIRYQFECMKKSWAHDSTLKRGYFDLTRMNFGQSDSDFIPEIKVGWGRFRRMPDDVVDTYESLKSGTQDTALQDMYDRRQKGNRMDKVAKINRKLLLKMYEDEKMTYEEISEFLGGDLTPSTIKGYLSQARKERDNQ